MNYTVQYHYRKTPVVVKGYDAVAAGLSQQPQIDHVGIARAYGLDGERVSRPGDLAGALERAVAAEKNGQAYVLDVLIDRRGGAADVNWHEKYVPKFSS